MQFDGFCLLNGVIIKKDEQLTQSGVITARSRREDRLQ